MHRGVTVYVAGPYTRPDPIENTHRTIKVADELMELGFSPFIPHLTAFWHLVSPKPYETWLAIDLVWMRKCDVVLRLSGESSGADKEIEEAERVGIPVFYDTASLLAWADNRAAG